MRIDPFRGLDHLRVQPFCTRPRYIFTMRARRRLRRPEAVAAERQTGSFGRGLVLGDALNTSKAIGGYPGGDSAVRLPVAEEAKPNRTSVSTTSRREIAA